MRASIHIRRLSVLVVSVIVMTFLSGCSNYTEYVPIVLNVERGDHTLVEQPDLLSDTHIDAMTKILSRYGEPYKIIDGKLYIKSSLQADRDLLQNYTFKAEALIRDGAAP